MAVEYEHFLIPSPNSVYPESGKVKELLDALAAGKWLPNPGEGPPPQIRIIETETVSHKSHSRKMKYSFSTRVMHFLFEKVFFRGAKEVSESSPHVRVRMHDAPWPFSEEWLAGHLKSGLSLEFDVPNLADSGLRFPLNRRDHPADETYYKIHIRHCFDYVNFQNEYIEGLSDASCKCGVDLEFRPEGDVFYSSRLHALCPGCGETFDPSDIPVSVTDGWTNESRSVNGGAVSRFSISMDCGKCIPKDGNIGFEADFVHLCESVLGCGFKQLGGVY